AETFTGRELRQQARTRLRSREVVEHRRRAYRRDERARCDRAAQRLDHDDELGQAEARALVLLGKVQAQPAEVGELVPERGQRLLFAFEQRAPGAARVVRAQELAGDSFELAEVIVDGDRHGAEGYTDGL